MSLASLFLARLYNLSPAQSGVRRHRGIRVAMADGATLATEVFEPRAKGPHPTLLMREPYGLSGFSRIAELFAERGYIFVLQACRGTDRSDGEFDPLTHERDDGLATLAWIKAQPWFDGRLGTTGPSYLGYAQWAISDSLPPGAAMATKVTSAEFRSVVFPGGGFALGLWLSWLQTVEGLRGDVLGTARRMMSGGIERATLRATMTLPLSNADQRAIGHKVPFWNKWLDNAVDNEGFWAPLDHTVRISAATPPNSFTSGWYDFMLDQLIRDYQSMRAAGHTPHLTIGPWFHVSSDLQRESVRQTFEWMDHYLLGTRPLRLKPVLLHVSGREHWYSFDSFPPPRRELALWYLHPDSVLSQRPVRTTPPDTYRYNPADPTPAIGGAMFAFSGAGPVDQAELEARKDVLSYTSVPLLEEVTLVGQPTAIVFMRADLETADLFVRLCDVAPSGQSINITDGYQRLTAKTDRDADGVWQVRLRLHHTGHSFKVGHRLRVLIASGAHPRFARNTGTSEALGDATTLKPARIEIFHDPNRPSAVHLPMVDLPTESAIT
jgi:putative CocE/NonD family hydrolase